MKKIEAGKLTKLFLELLVFGSRKNSRLFYAYEDFVATNDSVFREENTCLVIFR